MHVFMLVVDRSCIQLVRDVSHHTAITNMEPTMLNEFTQQHLLNSALQAEALLKKFRDDDAYAERLAKCREAQ